MRIAQEGNAAVGEEPGGCTVIPGAGRASPIPKPARPDQQREGEIDAAESKRAASRQPEPYVSRWCHSTHFGTRSRDIKMIISFSGSQPHAYTPDFVVGEELHASVLEGSLDPQNR
jgi:hypothetical protein